MSISGAKEKPRRKATIKNSLLLEEKVDAKQTDEVKAMSV